jgi:hypothetical protein
MALTPCRGCGNQVSQPCDRAELTPVPAGSCPQCGSNHVQKVSLAYETGSSTGSAIVVDATTHGTTAGTWRSPKFDGQRAQVRVAGGRTVAAYSRRRLDGEVCGETGSNGIQRSWRRGAAALPVLHVTSAPENRGRFIYAVRLTRPRTQIFGASQAQREFLAHRNPLLSSFAPGSSPTRALLSRRSTRHWNTGR